MKLLTHSNQILDEKLEKQLKATKQALLRLMNVYYDMDKSLQNDLEKNNHHIDNMQALYNDINEELYGEEE